MISALSPERCDTNTVVFTWTSPPGSSPSRSPTDPEAGVHRAEAIDRLLHELHAATIR